MSTALAGTRYPHLLVVYVSGGSSFFVVKIIVGGGGVNALQLQGFRTWAAAVLLVAVALFGPGRPRGVPLKALALAALSGVLMWAAGNGLATYSSAHASSSFIVMAMGMIPLWSVAVEAVATRRPPSRLVLVGLGIGLVGLGLVVGPGLVTASIVSPEFAVRTVTMLVGASLTWAIGTSIQRRVAHHFPVVWLAGIQFSAAALALTIPVLVQRAPLSAPTGNQWIAFAYLVVFASAVSVSSYVVVVKRFSPAIASTFAYVNPIVGVLLGVVFLHEKVEPVSLTGLAVVLASVFLIFTTRTAPPVPATETSGSCDPVSRIAEPR